MSNWKKGDEFQVRRDLGIQTTDGLDMTMLGLRGQVLTVHLVIGGKLLAGSRAFMAKINLTLPEVEKGAVLIIDSENYFFWNTDWIETI